MFKRTSANFILAMAIFAQSIAMKYDGGKAVEYSEKEFCPISEAHQLGFLHCLRYVFRSNEAGGLKVPEKRISKEDWPEGCEQPEFPVTEDEFLKGSRYLNYLRNRLGCPYAQWTAPHFPATPDDIENRLGTRLCPGDDVWFIWKDGKGGHVVIVVDTSPNDIKFKGQNILYKDPLSEYKASLFSYIEGYKKSISMLGMVHIPSEIEGDKDPRYVLRSDSTVDIDFGGPPGSGAGQIRHAWICCWHENLANTWPWYSDSSAYVCLSWQETRGTTWDTLISPRMNLVGCSSVVFRQRCYSNLLRGGNKVIKIMGSTNDGATWTDSIGTDTTTQASLPWATNQRNVRIAWIYKGSVQSGKYWCIDDIEIWAKPSLSHDVSVSGIVRPCGIMTPGKTVVPAAFVWNHGTETESISVRMTIGGYTDTRWVKLYPFNDTLLEFFQWTATPGHYTAICYSNLTGDELMSNDTATLNFIVAADTWVSMFSVYNQGVNTGACITSTDNEELYCVTGRRKFFAKYLISQNLWKTRKPTPKSFSRGGCITYANGNYLYGLKGGNRKAFYRYSIPNNTWDTLRSTLAKISKGGAIAYSGGNYIYALRGNRKKSFYRYNISSNSWETRADAPDKIHEGGSLVWTGGDSLYALQGDDETGFYLYRISTNQWTTKASIPAEVGNGGSLAYDSITKKIYAFCGDRTRSFYVYNISTNTWSTRQQTPYPVKIGGCLTYADNSIYGIMGRGYDFDFWRYSPPAGGDFDEPGIDGEIQTLDMLKYEPNEWFSKGAEEQVTYDPSDKFRPQYSPDGNWIAYTVEDTLNECLNIYKIPPEGGEAINLTNDTISYENQVWSSDNSWIMASGDYGLYKVTSDGSEPSVLIANGVISEPKWTSDDEWIYFERWCENGENNEYTHNIYKVRNDGTDTTCLLRGSGEYLQPQPLSDSEAICVKLKGECYQIYKIVNGQETQLTSDYFQNANPSLSPDGQWITYQKLDETGYWQIYKMLNDGLEETKLSNDECNYETPVFSPDGEWIAFSKCPKDTSGSFEYSQICYISKDGGEEFALNDPDGIREYPCWSPDNAYIAYEKITDDASCQDKTKKHKQLFRVSTNLKFRTGKEGDTRILPKVFALYQNKPNPFRSKTNIRYAIPIECQVDLDIFDITGRILKTLVNNKQKPDYYTITWDGRDNNGKRVSQGIYFYTLRADGKLMKKKMLLLR
jgi:Tol biopolymer transport system component